MARAIRGIVAATLLATVLTGAVPLRGGIAVEGGADGFPGFEISSDASDPCLARGGGWGVSGPGQFPGHSFGPYWGSIPGAAEGGIAADIPVAVDDGTAEVGEGEVSPRHFAARSDMASCGAGGAFAGWPVAELPVWTPFGGAALDGSAAGSDASGINGGVAGGAVSVGALASNAFWPGIGTFTPGTFTPGTFTPGIFTPGSVIDRKLASPANGDNGSGGNGDDGDGTTLVDDVTLVVGEPTPGLTPGPTPGPGSGAAVIPEPGMLLLLGIAMVALGLLRREWA